MSVSTGTGAVLGAWALGAGAGAGAGWLTGGGGATLGAQAPRLPARPRRRKRDTAQAATEAVRFLHVGQVGRHLNSGGHNQKMSNDGEA